MKKLILGMLMLMLALPIFAATSANLILTGTVAQILNVSMDSGANFTLNTAGTTISLGNISITSNLKSWVLKISSSNGSKLKNNATPPEEIIYRVTLGTAFPVTQGLAEVTLSNAPPIEGVAGYIMVVGKTPKAGISLPLSIKYEEEGTAFWSFDKGNFTDTIWVSVAPN